MLKEKSNNQEMYMQQNYPSKMKVKSRHFQINKKAERIHYQKTYQRESSEENEKSLDSNLNLHEEIKSTGKENYRHKYKRVNIFFVFNFLSDKRQLK